MKVSAIILTYNRAQVLTEAIDSVLDQTFKDFELIVVDNYSSDNTESIVASYTDKRIRYFKNQNNGFMGINRNFGIEKSGGEYIAFLDDDDLWLPEKLEKQVELLDSNKALGLVYSDSYMMDINGNLAENTYFHDRRPVRGDAFVELLQYDPVPMLTALIRKEVLDRVGLFNPRYRIALDYDLWLRIAEHYPIDFIEQPLAKYRVHAESGYQKNTALAYREELQILDYWLNRENSGKRKLAGRIRRKKASLYQMLMAYYYVNHKRLDAFRESINLIRLLPYSLGIVPSVVADLSRYLTRR
jgi:glycosyltransferase involved in cell wall biosynthesis